ncbi:hypothetical protein A0257_04530 [Hymenobacter psoromatis]|nr:hypothetical protein A0257_04530 [Hymenobacter psoromatis]
MPAPYASVIIKLLQSHALYDTDDRAHWQQLETHETAVRAHFAQLGVVLDLNRADGYARLTQPEPADDDPAPPLRLLRRVPLSYEQALLGVVLREWLEEHESSAHAASPRLYATREQLRERVELFFRQQPNQKAFLSKLDTIIERLTEHGFLKITHKDDLHPDQTRYEVKPLLKAKISLEKLSEFLEKLRNHAESV